MIREIKAKTVLQKSKLPKSPYCLNPYTGCLHNCVYCYACFMRRFTGHTEPWGSFVDVKINSPEILSQQLLKSSVKDTVLIGSVCDAYQPIEKKYKLTRSCIRLLIKHNITFSILTKSDLVLRDLDLLKLAGTNASIGISLSILDERIRRKFEPGASSVQERLHTMEKLRANNVSTYVFIGPILPYVTDVQAIIEAVSPYVDAVWAEAINMHGGIRARLSSVYDSCQLPDIWQYQACDQIYWSETAQQLKQLCHQEHIDFVEFFKH